MQDISYQNPLCWSIGSEPRQEIDEALFYDEYLDELEELARYRDEFSAEVQDEERNR